MNIKPKQRYQEPDLLEKLKAGNVAAFNVLFDEYSSKVYSFARRYLKSGVETEELVQDTFVKIWENKHKIDCSLPFNGFLFTIAYRLILNRIRNNQREVAKKRNLVFMPAAVSPASDQKYIYKELEQLIQAAISALPTKRKLIFQMSRQQEKSNQEIADNLNISRKTVEAQMTEALKQIRKYLTKNGGLYTLLFSVTNIF